MEIVFVVNVFHDQTLALHLTLQIRHFYPEALLLVLGDGVKVDRALGQQASAWFELPRLKLHPSGVWTDRYLQIALRESNADVILKFDPDTHLDGRFNIPCADWFGFPKEHFIFGFATGFSRGVAQDLVASRLLRQPSKRVYLRSDERLYPGEQTLIPSQDLIVGDAMQALGVPWTRWEEANNFRCAPRETG